MSEIDSRIKKLKSIQKQVADLSIVVHSLRKELLAGTTRLRDLCLFKIKSTVSIFNIKGWEGGHDITIAIPDSLKSLLIAEIEKQIAELREQGAAI